jgi:hypothetical protein
MAVSLWLTVASHYVDLRLRRRVFEAQPANPVFRTHRDDV